MTQYCFALPLHRVFWQRSYGNWLKRSHLRVNIFERAGRSTRSLLPGIEEDNGCGREDCMIHTTGGKGNCKCESVVYKGTCVTCAKRQESTKSIYYGESGRSAYVRGKQHISAIKNPMKHPHNGFAKHIYIYKK